MPLIENGEVIGVLDLDSPRTGAFRRDRSRGLRAAGRAVCRRTIARRWPRPGKSIRNPGCRLPLPRREELDAEGQQAWDRLASPDGGSLRGLRGPGGIQLHSPELARRARPLNHYLRHQAGLGGRVRELAILATAREHDNAFEWAAHEPAASAEGISPQIIDLIRWRGATARARRARRHRHRARPRNLRRPPGVADRPTPARSSNSANAKLVDLVALMGNYAATAALLDRLRHAARSRSAAVRAALTGCASGVQYRCNKEADGARRQSVSGGQAMDLGRKRGIRFTDALTPTQLMLVVGVLLVLAPSSSSIGQQQGTPTVPQSASCQGPPLETAVNSLSEESPLWSAGHFEFTTVYHADGTFNLKITHVASFWSSENPVQIYLGLGDNHGRWSLKGCTFCFVLDHGKFTGKKICKGGRLIGRVSIGGTPLSDGQPNSYSIY